MTTKGDLESSATQSRKTLAEHHQTTELANPGQKMQQKKEVWDDSNEDEAERVDDDFTSSERITSHLSEFDVRLESELLAERGTRHGFED